MNKNEKIYYFNLNENEKNIAIANFEKIRSDIIYCLDIIFSDKKKLISDLSGLKIKYIDKILVAIENEIYKKNWSFSPAKKSLACFHGLTNSGINTKIRYKIYHGATENEINNSIIELYNKYYFNSDKNEYENLFNFNSKYLYLLLELEFSEYKDIILAKLENLILHEIIHSLFYIAPVSHDNNFRKLGCYLAEKIGLKDPIIDRYENSSVFTDFYSADYFVIENENRLFSGIRYSNSYFDRIAAGYYEHRIAIYGTDRAIEFRNKILELELKDLYSGGAINRNSHCH